MIYPPRACSGGTNHNGVHPEGITAFYKKVRGNPLGVTWGLIPLVTGNLVSISNGQNAEALASQK
jgi:hypothetical protein